MTGLSWKDAGIGAGELLDPDGRPVARYEWQRANHPYFDAVRPLGSAGILTNHAPHDHRWHHGLWWSWKFIDDVLFWEDHSDYGGNRIGLGRSIVTDHAVAGSAGTVTISQTLAWRVDADRRDLLTERRTIAAALDPDDESRWMLDWDQTWTALTAVRLEATPWPEISWGGYAGLNYRAARSMSGDEELLGDGVSGADQLHGTRSAWASYSGTVDGAETDDPDHPAHGGIALLQHPENPGFPHPVYAASAAGGFGFLATAPIMHDSIQLEAAETLRLRTRVVVLGSQLDSDAMSRAQHRYARTEPAPVT